MQDKHLNLTNPNRSLAASAAAAAAEEAENDTFRLSRRRKVLYSTSPLFTAWKIGERMPEEWSERE